MKKFITILAFLFTFINVSFGQKYWEKTIEKDFYDVEKVNLRYRSSADIYAVFSVQMEELYVLSYFPKAKSWDITWNAFIENGGKVCDDKEDAVVAVNYSGNINYIATTIGYLTVDEPSYYYFSIIVVPLSLEEMLKGSHVKIRYFERLLNDWQEETISLIGFTKAYNSKGTLIK